jgi:Undecaprenyl-phosphate glucose phosphotransferase
MMKTVIDLRANAASPEIQGVLARTLDVALIVLGAVAASVCRPGGATREGDDWTFVAFSVACALFLFPMFGVYRSWRGRSKLRLAGRISVAWFVVQACAVALMFSLHWSGPVSRLWSAYWTLNTLVVLVLSRVAIYSIWSRMRSAGCDLRTVGVIGVGAHCENVLTRVAASPASGFRAVAHFILRPTAPFDAPGAASCSALSSFAAYVRENKVREVWVALPLSEERTLRNILDEFSGDLVNVRFIPDVQSLVVFGGEMIELMGAPAINLVASPLSGNALLQKAIFDRLFAIAALIAVAPLMVAIAIAVKLSSKGPVFFRQTRKGADGKVFRIFKFRTMRAHVEQVGVVQQATRNDPRITPLGAFLRRTSLDELPQFLNVLRGEMSIVGPRPHATAHDDHYQKIVDNYIHRYRIKPGITGWAQVNGFRGETDRVEKMQSRVEYDLYYLRNWSLKFDIRIVIATVMKGLVHRNAY